MAEPQVTFTFNVPEDFDETARQIVGRKAVDLIIERTNNGVDRYGNKFAPYSESYINSLDFKNAGKSADEVNLQLTGEMLLGGLQVISQGPGFVTLGFEPGTPENDKAAWNQASDNGPSRSFVGLMDKELELIIAETRIEQPRNLSSLRDDEIIQRVVVTPGRSITSQRKIAKTVTRDLIKNILKQQGVDISQEDE